ncbi:hypothetical protein F5Y16DRAFT_410546 [Xylariaceae sp. FL0255]|nr:hypothetical protein F5Y16DRAFT_410546 [Xylariaceae sp. FL0255]
MDPVEKLFKDLPSPDARKPGGLNLNSDVEERVKKVLGDFDSYRSIDVDRGILATYAKEFLDGKYTFEGFMSKLGRWSVERAQTLNDGSAKSHQVKHYRWIYNGRKDEDNPVTNSAESSEQDKNTQTHINHAFLPPTSIHSCASCGKTDAKAACSGCSGKLGSHVIMMVPYCDKDCQTRHWKEHKSQCRGRKMVWRAVSLIYDSFIMFQRKAYINRAIEGIVDQEGVTYVNRSPIRECAFQGRPLISSFSSVRASSEETALAALMDSECNQFLTAFHGFVKLLLLPLCKSIQEVTLSPKNAYRPTCDIEAESLPQDIHVRVNNSMFGHHTVLRATLQSGEEFVVDCTGAQFGWHETVAPWGPWINHRGNGEFATSPFGSSKERVESFLWKLITPRASQVCDSQRLILAEKMQSAAAKEMVEAKLEAVTDLFQLPESDFVARKQVMLSSIEKALDDGLQQLQDSKVCLAYLDAEGKLQVTETKQQAEALKEVWLSDKDVKNAKRKDTDLRLMYQQRCTGSRKAEKFKAAGLNLP